ncbi:MAG TPA: ABC transporter permease subunit [Bacteroidia bacterium]|nr:ABC transporter permease subunit [Bacteroidia bacterium]
MGKISKYVILDLIRNRIVISYLIVLLAISFTLFNLDSNPVKGILGLLNISLLIVPLVSIIFGTIYYYNSSEFIELLLTMPIKRKQIIISVYTGLAVALSVAVILGMGIPILIYSPDATGLTLLVVSIALTWVFVSIAMLASVLTRDKAKGIGVVILLWLYFSLIYDGLLLFILFSFSDYPMEKPMVALSALNPIDLGRIYILLQLDISAIMGYTGAIYRDFLGGTTGMIFAMAMLLTWIFIPLFFSVRRFKRKDI